MDINSYAMKKFFTYCVFNTINFICHLIIWNNRFEHKVENNMFYCILTLCIMMLFYRGRNEAIQMEEGRPKELVSSTGLIFKVLCFLLHSSLGFFKVMITLQMFSFFHLVIWIIPRMRIHLQCKSSSLYYYLWLERP